MYLNSKVVVLASAGLKESRHMEINNIGASIRVDVEYWGIAIFIDPFENAPLGGFGCIVLQFFLGCTCA